ALGIKQLDNDPYALFFNNYDKGSILKGKVKSVAEQEAVIELAEGVEAILTAREASSEKVDNLNSLLKLDEEVEVMITNIDKRNRVINISIKAKDAKDEAEAIKKVKNAEKAAGTTNLGALLQDKFSKE
ncbi:MAG TPA: S1 RNA-binding domain-containing protein, partial [Burkholderiales bacterium]|nr:S1 RNA-binding domain-containing protein [Burkholderiales bacterium]